MSQEVIYYSYDEVGAPALNDGYTAGQIVAILDACLVNGYNARAVTSLTVASGTCTAVVSAHGYKAGRVVGFAGATSLTGLNGNFRIDTVPDANTFTFACPGVGDGVASGAITAKRPGLGWTIARTATNKRLYARSKVDATAYKLRVDDSDTSGLHAWCQGGAGDVDIDTFAETFPTPAQVTAADHAVYVSRGTSGVATLGPSKPWILVGDGYRFYLFTPTHYSSTDDGATGGLACFGFGDAISFAAADPYCCFIGGGQSGGDFGFLNSNGLTAVNSGNYTQMYLARGFTGIGGSVEAGTISHGSQTGAADGPLYPSPLNNGGIVNDKVLVHENNTAFNLPIRARMPGLVEPLFAVPQALHRAVISNVAGSTHRYLAVRTYCYGHVGGWLIDLDTWS